MLPDITYLHAVGLFMLTTFFKNHNFNKLKEEFYKDDEVNRIVQNILSPWIMLFCGFIVKILIDNY